jgi:hypothetical protein
MNITGGLSVADGFFNKTSSGNGTVAVSVSFLSRPMSQRDIPAC